jgi:hypothetical protein
MPADFSSVAASKDTTTARKYLRAGLFLNFDFRSALLKKNHNSNAIISSCCGNWLVPQRHPTSR